VEFLTGRATIGASSFRKESGRDAPICLKQGPQFLGHVRLDNPVAKKAHFTSVSLNNKGKLVSILRHPRKFIFSHWDRDQKLVFILRHPMEAILSQRYKIFDEINSTKPIPMDVKNKLKKDAENFLGNIKFYENFSGQKEIVLYEDLVGGKHEKAIKSLTNIFDCDEKRLSDLLENFDVYKDDSIKSPNRKSISDKKNGGNFYYSDMIKATNPANLEDFMNVIGDLLKNETIIKHYY
jgi:hypothetical protein